MVYRFLIDECLSPRLVHEAHAAGHQATAIRDLGMCGKKDHEVIDFAVKNDWTLVTNNSVDFRGPAGGPAGGLYALEDLHAGLVCLNCEDGALDYPKQVEAFRGALAGLPPDLVNQALEVTMLVTGGSEMSLYFIPDEKP
ncbi:DUF5615 family PIN-like protein [Pseudomonas aeruginosa]|uniref:DUF5615 family PIN-like protein n=1 Tax=Pseudomonas aeruginosa TaxID=287 RepID=UPI002E29BDA6|nr:DUF5615 family PIN-like protein [Pseudomonas aeruginosa]